MESTLGKTVVKFLKDNPEQRFTAREIASWIFETYSDECREKQNRSAAIINPLNTDSALIQQFVAEIGSQRLSMQKKNPQIKVTERAVHENIISQEIPTVQKLQRPNKFHLISQLLQVVTHQ